MDMGNRVASQESCAGGCEAGIVHATMQPGHRLCEEWRDKRPAEANSIPAEKKLFSTSLLRFVPKGQ
jgi:hypothetical protein